LEALHVKSGLFPAGAVRALALAVPFLGLLSGCDNEDRYSGDLTYPLRADVILVNRPSATPFYPAPPGHVGPLDVKGEERDQAETRNPRDLPADDRKEIGGLLAQYFGTPAEPLVGGAYDKLAADVKESVDKLKLEPDHLREGSKAYRRHCLHCHGLTGDGRGPTGPWISPHPRDYRQGVFKFISTATSVSDPGSGDALQRKARRTDLLRTLRTGIDGTSMPSFGLLPEEQLEDLASYVIHLSLRGQVEMDITNGLLSKELNSGDLKDKFEERFQSFLRAWRFSDEARIEPRKYPYNPRDEDQRLASVRRGFAVFRGKGACIGCHVDYGREVPFRYDDWGTLVRPANLTTGVYRGGRRPVDLYWRVVGGIPPSQMPAAEDLLKRDEAKNADDAWTSSTSSTPCPTRRCCPRTSAKRSTK